MVACDVTVFAEVDARADGTGTVRAGVGLDADALDKAGDLSGTLEIDDLRQAGWDVVGPRQEGDGLTWVRASKPFSSPEQADRILAELSGPEGPFRNLHLVQRRSFFHTRTSFNGEVDLSGGLTAFVDPQLEERLGGALGFDLEALRKQFGPELGDVFRVEFIARLPGSVRASTGQSSDGRAEWLIEPGQRVNLDAQAAVLNLVPWLPAIGALLAVAAALAVALWHRRRSDS
ncbi:MAG: hypothetical protein M3179_02755 [Actinomycetota bacterium]|nr:hypothetical protein [Actinomycetota bacterium]